MIGGAECIGTSIAISLDRKVDLKVIDQELAAQVKAMQQKYPEQIVFHNGLGLDEVYQMYREIDFLVCSSRDDPMPVVAAEAMSFGKPCICSCNTGTAAIIKHYEAGDTYDGDDPELLSQLISHAYHMPRAEYKRISANARCAYEEVFSEEVFAKNLAEIIKKLAVKRVSD